MTPTIYKFGGASIQDAAHMKHVAGIILAAKSPIIVVISAMGKITNALEEVVDHVIAGHLHTARNLIDEIAQKHLAVVEELALNDEKIQPELSELFGSLKDKIEKWQHKNADFIYDQIICNGELASTRIVNSLLNGQKKSQWIDARRLIATDDTYRDAKIDWKQTQKNIQDYCDQLFQSCQIGITQGFIGGHGDHSTSLGREGSDFTASIFGYCLDAERITIWKDVKGILTGDPRIFENVIKLDRLTYREAIEMTYYGAKVIHPKTIKPLQNKGIPLYVKSYIHPDRNGTLISSGMEINYPPIIVIEKNQCLIHISTKDFSFVAEEHLSELFRLFHEYRLKINMMRNTAISFTVCVTNHEARLNQLIARLESSYTAVVDRNLELFSVRHFNEATLSSLLDDKIVIFEERIGQTAQMVVRSAPTIRLK